MAARQRGDGRTTEPRARPVELERDEGVRRSDLRLRVLVDPRRRDSRAVPRDPGPEVETVTVHDPVDVVRELAASSGLYRPLERWPESSIAAPALAHAVGVPAHVSAHCDAAEAATDRGELLASDAPEALLAPRSSTPPRLRGPVAPRSRSA